MASSGTFRIRVLFLISLLAFGCTPNPAPPLKTEATLLSFVAASTKDAVQDIATAFTAETGVVVTLNADDSSKLALQISNGAPAAVFLSANQQWLDFVKDKQLVQKSTALLGNTLVLIVPAGNPAKLESPADLTKPAVKKVALAGPTVPVGIYGRQALTTFKVLDELERTSRIVSGENVRATLAFVERGEVEAGIVYGTDAKISKQVAVVTEFPATSHKPIVYPLGLLSHADKNPAARRWYDYLRSPKAATIFRQYGFTRADSN